MNYGDETSPRVYDLNQMEEAFWFPPGCPRLLVTPGRGSRQDAQGWRQFGAGLLCLALFLCGIGVAGRVRPVRVPAGKQTARTGPPLRPTLLVAPELPQRRSVFPLNDPLRPHGPFLVAPGVPTH